MTAPSKAWPDGFMRVRVLWGALSVVGLGLWYFQTLRSLTWQHGAILSLALLSLACSEAFLIPRLRLHAGVTMLLSVAELVFLVWLVWLLAS